MHVSWKMILRDILPVYVYLCTLTEASCHSLPMTNAIFERYPKFIQGVQMHSEAIIQGTKFTENVADCNSQSNLKGDAENAANNNIMSNLKMSSRHDLALIFTCKVCETRSMKTCCRESYEKGVVVVRCGECKSQHLIADRLGWFGEPGSVEDFLAASGEEVKKGSVDSLNLTLEDFAGKTV